MVYTACFYDFVIKYFSENLRICHRGKKLLKNLWHFHLSRELHTNWIKIFELKKHLKNYLSNGLVLIPLNYFIRALFSIYPTSKKFPNLTKRKKVTKISWMKHKWQFICITNVQRITILFPRYFSLFNRLSSKQTNKKKSNFNL